MSEPRYAGAVGHPREDRPRDAAGRPRNDRPRDGLGRPLPRRAVDESVERIPDDLVLPPDESLTQAQRLLDAGRPFHAHEILEGTWKAAAAGERDLWQGLAQLAVGVTHLARGNPRGAAALLRRGAARLAPYGGDPPHGVDVQGLVAWAGALATERKSGPPPRLRIPPQVGALALEWRLTLGARSPSGRHWSSEAVRDDGTPTVLTVGRDGFASRAAFLREAGGQGVVRLLAEDAGAAALLLERAVPGGTAEELVPAADPEATAALLGVMHRLQARPVEGSALPELRRLRGTFERYLARYPGAGRAADGGPLPPGLVDRASRLFDELVADAPAAVRLHGNLHHATVRRATREPWLATDPLGLVGDPGFEAGALLHRPWPDRRDEALLALVPARVEQLAGGLGQPVERIAAWGFVTAVRYEIRTHQAGGRPGSRALDVAASIIAGT